MQTFMGGKIGPGLLTANGTHISMVPSQHECLNLVVGSGLSKWMVHSFSYEYFDFLPLSREIHVNQISDSKLATHVM